MRLNRPSREGNPGLLAAIQGDLEGVGSGVGQGDIEDQDCGRFHIGDAGRRFPELDGSFAAQKLGAGLVYEADTDGMDADFGSPAPNPKNEMSTRVKGRKGRDPHVLKQPKDGELALLVYQGVVGQDGEVEVQVRSLEWS